jgi:hypothetical protein
MKAKVEKKPKRASKLKAVLEATKELSSADKRKLFNVLEDELIGSIQLQPWQIEELEKSEAEYRANPKAVRRWEDVRAELMKKYER